MTKMTPMEIVEWLDAAFATGDREDKMDQAVATLRAFIEANQPWLPPQQEGFGPWIEWKPGDLGPRVGDIVRILQGASRGSRRWDRQTFEGPAKQWSWCGNYIVAYCVKLPDADDKAVGRKYAFENGGCGDD